MKPNEGPRKENESLHDYFTRKKIKCFCNDCRRKEKDVNSSTSNPVDSNVDDDF